MPGKGLSMAVKVVLIKNGEKYQMVVPHRCPLHVPVHLAARGKIGGIRWEPYADREAWARYLGAES